VQLFDAALPGGTRLLAVTSVGDGGVHWIVIKERSAPGTKHVL
jgi:hypothetical protein